MKYAVRHMCSEMHGWRADFVKFIWAVHFRASPLKLLKSYASTNREAQLEEDEIIQAIYWDYKRIGFDFMFLLF